MARFYRYETVDIPLKFTPVGVLNDWKHIVVSIAQNGLVQINKSDNELSINTEEDTITISLNQEETALFAGGRENSPKTADIQVNIYYNSTERDVSTTGSIEVYENLYEEIIDDE